MRRAAKVDDNQPEIVSALRAVGARVECLHGVGGGVTDLLVLFQGDLFLLEVKDGNKPPSDRKLTPAQVAWHREFANPNLHVVCNVQEALDAIGAKYEPF